MIQKASSNSEGGKATYAEKYVLFEKFSQSALGRLGLHGSKEINLAGLWKKSEPFAVSNSYFIFFFFFSQFSWMLLCLETFRRSD